MTTALKYAPMGADTSADATGVQYGRLVTDPVLLVAQAMSRRFSTPKGRLRSDPTYGMSLVEWLLTNDPNDQNTLALQQEMRAEAMKDERLDDVEFSASSPPTNGPGKELDVQVVGQLVDGTSFQFALSVHDVSVDLIFQANTSNA